MILVLVIVIGVLFGAGTYLVLHRTLTRLALGIGLWTYAANALLLLSGGRAGRPPLVDGERASGFADPLPQAMILTAIVIGFGMTAFLLALAYRSWTHTGNDEAEDDIEDRRIAALAHERPVEVTAEEEEG
ncbi:MAG TPA: Na(+)/H(+) antiporter subunit C [Bryobacteraceae bacterium]|nr:Na(+)/H(+) antiporter subunit C [Bryobacteraceae bacterium]HOL73025.1 Na(+)/H(+) antiporter subunit C [Bryobacteraceae bacterium]HPQ14496.1 Na(+)/H(+) antiporter subunit C [Bryobacteraceae bacterium]